MQSIQHREIMEQIHYFRHGLLSSFPLAEYQVSLLESMIPMCEQYRALEHALLLMSSTHRTRGSEVCLRHKSKALKLFQQGLLKMPDCAILATIFALLCSDLIESGRSAWRVHLSAVKKILGGRTEAGLPLAEDRLQMVLILQFFWWDTMGSLLSMQEPVLPYEWLQQLFSETKRVVIAEHAKSFSMINSEDKFLALNRLANRDFDSVEEIAPLPVRKDDSTGIPLMPFDTLQEGQLVEQIWKHAMVLYSFVSVAPYPAGKSFFDAHVNRIFEIAMQLDVSSPARRQILFPLTVAGSCTYDPSKRQFIQRYCLQCFEQTQFGYYQLGLSILQKSWGLREREAIDRKHLGGSPYSCWRNVTATRSTSFAVLG